MLERKKGLFAITLFVLFLFALSPVASLATSFRSGAATLVQIPGTTVPIPTGSVSQAPLSMVLDASVGLNPNNPSGLDDAVLSVITPGSPGFHDYYTHSSLEQDFGPTSSQYSSVWNYLSSEGLTVSQGLDDFSINVKGTVAQLQNAFNVQINLIQNGSNTFFANTNSVSLPSSVAPFVSSVLGLENVSQYVPTLVMNPKSPYYGLTPNQAISDEQSALEQQGILTPAGGIGTAAPQPPYGPHSTEAAYNETGIVNHEISPCGTQLVPCGQYTNGEYMTIAVVDAYGDPTATSDLEMYDTTFNMTNLLDASFPQCIVDAAVNEGASGVVPWCNDVVTPSFSVLYPFGQPSPETSANAVTQLWELETALDIQMSHSTAPGANIISVVTPDSSLTLNEGVAYVIANSLANVVSMSFGEPDLAAGPAINYMHVYFEMAAAQGISVLAASGDSGAIAPGGNTVDTSWPAADPYVFAVGGTTLFMSGVVSTGETNPLNGPPSVPEVLVPQEWQNEEAWTGYSGGGHSPVFTRPVWQVGEGLPASGKFASSRGVPDAAADGMFAGNLFYVNGQLGASYLFGGTSFACPLVAGMIATMDSYLTQSSSAFGFIGLASPALYQVLNSPFYSSAIHDITVGSNNGYYNTPGWDPVDGIGSFNVGVLTTVLSSYSFTSGVEASSTSPSNSGSSVSVQTITSSSSQQFGGLDQYYLEQPFSNGATLIVGYSDSSQSSIIPSNAFFYAVIPSGSLFRTEDFNFESANSAGTNGTWNTYSITQSSGVWTLSVDGNALTSYSDAGGATALQPLALVTSYGVTNTFNSLTAKFQDFAIDQNSTFSSVTVGGEYFTSTNFLDTPPAPQLLNNPLGIDVLAPDSWIGGSGLASPANGSQLWSASSKLTVKTNVPSTSIYVDGTNEGTGSIGSLIVSAGPHMVTLSPVTGFVTPSLYNVQVLSSEGQVVENESVASSSQVPTVSGYITVVTANFVKEGTLNVILNPSELATVYVNGTVEGTGGISGMYLAPGDYVVSFQSLNQHGLRTPRSVIVKISSGGMATVTASYKHGTAQVAYS